MIRHSARGEQPAGAMAGCGELVDVGRRRLVAERGMRPGRIVIGDPGADDPPCVDHTEEQALVQQLVAHPTVEALAEAVLHRLAGGDVVPVDAVFGTPSADRVRSQLGTVAQIGRAHV